MTKEDFDEVEKEAEKVNRPILALLKADKVLVNGAKLALEILEDSTISDAAKLALIKQGLGSSLSLHNIFRNQK